MSQFANSALAEIHKKALPTLEKRASLLDQTSNDINTLEASLKSAATPEGLSYCMRWETGSLKVDFHTPHHEENKLCFGTIEVVSYWLRWDKDKNDNRRLLHEKRSDSFSVKTAWDYSEYPDNLPSISWVKENMFFEKSLVPDNDLDNSRLPSLVSSKPLIECDANTRIIAMPNLSWFYIGVIEVLETEDLQPEILCPVSFGNKSGRYKTQIKGFLREECLALD